MQPLDFDRQQVLSQVALFSPLKDVPEALKALSEIMIVKDFSIGTELTKEGQEGDEAYILVKGQVSIYKRTPDGDTYKVLILKDEVKPAFGEGGLIDNEARSATVTCDVPSVCLVLNRKNFDEFSGKYPKWALPIYRKIAQTLMKRLSQTSYDLMLLHKALMAEIRGS